MNSFLNILFLLSIITCCIARNRQSVQDSQENTNGNYGMNVREAFRELLENKCEKAGGDAQVQKLYESVEEAKECLVTSRYQTSEELGDAQDLNTAENICSSKKEKVITCFKNFINTVQKCLVKEENYLPQFIMDGFNGAMDYMCGNNKQVINKVQKSSAKKCLQILSQFDLENNICGDKFTVLSNPNNIIKKSDLCKNLESAKTCYVDFLKVNCPNDQIMKELVVGMHKSITVSC